MSYSEEQARRIFARAAERQHAARAEGEALSLEELQAIGREAGIDPAHIAAAAAESDAATTAVGPTWLGMPLRHRAVRRADAPLDDATWGRVADHFVRDATMPGTFETVGDRQIYTSADGTRVSAAPDGDGTLLTVDSPRSPFDVLFYVMASLGAMMGGIGLMAYLAKGKESGLVIVAVMAALVAVSAVGSVIGARRRAARQPGEAEALADRLARLAEAPGSRAAAAVSDPPTPAAPEPTALEIDLDALPDAPAAAAADRPRDRTR